MACRAWRIFPRQQKRTTISRVWYSVKRHGQFVLEGGLAFPDSELCQRPSTGLVQARFTEVIRQAEKTGRTGNRLTPVGTAGLFINSDLKENHLGTVRALALSNRQG
jgi:hypothetical protein